MLVSIPFMRRQPAHPDPIITTRGFSEGLVGSRPDGKAEVAELLKWDDREMGRRVFLLVVKKGVRAFRQDIGDFGAKT